MKKIFIALLSVLFVFSLSGCATDGAKQEKTNKQEKVENVTKSVNNVDMKIEKVEMKENGKGDKNIMQLTMHFKNESDSKYGIGGNDFILKSSDKTYQVKSDANNIGTEIASGKSATGAVNFELPKDVKTGELVYQPVTPGKEKPKALATWEISLPNNK
ncbi:DUF4352 domain-containing protein [Paenilisteria rocourtiae]|uniref:Uncharacterized protein DUF4352 n=1 Tax=Listeria rocourtiae TaxID=647910 RepID=A0A4R6ZK91_9LIST|nr:DUF4352 domain-containing protein [Listeria rocourtiae]EUJ47018.1 lipoprotein [Listeria rocourtiae FSL F6-920]MBC1435037.1 DUF4352 domain-containing protein [Listeria rocourtiae]MBC1604526.1 DUF4352 domain-containing protein [Listeria rocourtiae]TDR52652.1 uncharacterized protein DUF4352 [Listeria rocourtiae]